MNLKLCFLKLQIILQEEDNDNVLCLCWTQVSGNMPPVSSAALFKTCTRTINHQKVSVQETCWLSSCFFSQHLVSSSCSSVVAQPLWTKLVDRMGLLMMVTTAPRQDHPHQVSNRTTQVADAAEQCQTKVPRQMSKCYFILIEYIVFLLLFDFFEHTKQKGKHKD